MSDTKAAELAGSIYDGIGNLHGLPDVIEGDPVENTEFDPMHDNRVIVTLASGTRLLIEVRPL
jgi:hypothetical protein